MEKSLQGVGRCSPRLDQIEAGSLNEQDLGKMDNDRLGAGASRRNLSFDGVEDDTKLRDPFVAGASEVQDGRECGIERMHSMSVEFKNSANHPSLRAAAPTSEGCGADVLR